MSLAEGRGLGKEGYTIDIDDVTEIEAEDAVGAYWATRSILQILKQTGGSIPKGLVRDYPKYKVRAFSLDVGRKPFTMDALYQFAKNMSWYKMNSFQIHLSDNLIFMEDYKNQQTGTEQEKLAKGLQAAKDQAYAGFRLESGVTNTDENYPELLGKSATSEDVYYTKDEFRQFVKDSRMIGIDIVPELDMPAHCLLPGRFRNTGQKPKQPHNSMHIRLMSWIWIIRRRQNLRKASGKITLQAMIPYLIRIPRYISVQMNFMVPEEMKASVNSQTI